MTTQECGNQHGFLCPRCKKGDQLRITASISTTLLPDGCDNTETDTEWDENSCAWCGCGWTGKVGQFKIVEIDDEPKPIEFSGSQPDVYNEH